MRHVDEMHVPSSGGQNVWLHSPELVEVGVGVLSVLIS